MCCAHSQIFRHKTKSYNLKLITASMYVSEYDMLILLLSLRKSVRIRSYSCPYFPAFGLNMERYSASLLIQSKCGKKRTRITPNKDTFYAVFVR